VRVVPDVVPAGRDHVLLPSRLGCVDAVIGSEHADAVVDGDAAEAYCVDPAHHPADVLGHEKVQLS
jgi:hypothetical protein